MSIKCKVEFNLYCGHMDMLAGAAIAGATLAGTILAGAALAGTTLAGATLAGAALAGAVLVWVLFAVWQKLFELVRLCEFRWLESNQAYLFTLFLVIRKNLLFSSKKKTVARVGSRFLAHVGGSQAVFNLVVFLLLI